MSCPTQVLGRSRTDTCSRDCYFKPRYVLGGELNSYEMNMGAGCVSSGIPTRPSVPMTAGQFMVRDLSSV